MNLRLVLMDQQKMGMFISELRKKNKLTKKELVNMLEIMDTSVFKWEGLV